MSTAFGAADLLLPKQEIGRENWAVVACDQYTSEPEYWSAVDRQVGVNKSTLRLILPELYLEEPDVQARIGEIHIAMKEYLTSDSFDEYKNAMVYVERIQSDGKCRAGLVGKIDLEAYDYTKGSESSVRATEATVLERIPPRIKVRRQAPLELPHIMILIDDAEQTVIEPLAEQKAGMEQVYDFDLMQGGGHLSGYLVPPALQIRIDKALTALADPEAFARAMDWTHRCSSMPWVTATILWQPRRRTTSSSNPSIRGRTLPIIRRVMRSSRSSICTAPLCSLRQFTAS